MPQYGRGFPDVLFNTHQGCLVDAYIIIFNRLLSTKKTLKRRERIASGPIIREPKKESGTRKK